MRKIILVVFIFLSGCASNQYGNFIKDKNDASEVIALDALSKMADIYLPAKTTFSLNQKIVSKDNFGRVFVTGLRDKGYAVEEFKKGNSPLGVQLAYTLDEADGIYRLTLYVGDKTLSRAYKNDAGLIGQASAWSRKE